MIVKLICFFKGHRRGKRVGESTNTTGSTYGDFRCPRCSGVWTRKVRKAKA